MEHGELTTPFRRTEGLRLGIPQHVLDGPAFNEPFRGVRVSRSKPINLNLRAQAALLLAPGAVVSHQSAATLWGGVVPDQADTHVTVARPADRPRREGLAAHVYRHPRETTTLHGMPITTARQTFVDLVGQLGLVDLVVLADSLIEAGATTQAGIVEAARTLRARPARLGRQAAALARARVESPMETRTRLLMALAGLPEPQINLVLEQDGITYRLDLGFPEYRLAIEYDGRQHAESSRQWQRDIGRREDLDRWGWRILVLTSADIYITPRKTLHRIIEAMGAAGMQVPPLSDHALREVDRHLPGRQP